MNITEDIVLTHNEQEFDLELNNKKRVLALVYATWCPFCMRFLAIYKKYAHRKSSFILAEDNQEELAERYDIDVIPTLLFFEEGALTKRADGIPGMGLTETRLVEFIRECGL